MTFTDPPPEFPAAIPKVDPDGREPLLLDELAARVEARTGAEHTHFYGLSVAKGDAIYTTLSVGYDPVAGFNGYDGNVYGYADPYTGELVWKYDPRQLPLAAQIFDGWVFPVHTGAFGGITTRILWALVGLAPTVLAVTGLTMWLLRMRAKRRRKRRRPAPA